MTRFPEAPAPVPETFEEARDQAGHHRGAMVERRNIGLRIVVGVVAFDLLVLKLGLDASERVDDLGALTWSLRLIFAFALLVVAGMLIQIEIRNRGDRRRYIAAELRMEAIRERGDPRAVVEVHEPLAATVRQSWASTWPLLGLLALTIALGWLAGLFSG